MASAVDPPDAAGLVVDARSMAIRDRESRRVTLQLSSKEDRFLPLHGVKMDSRIRVSVADTTSEHVVVAPALKIDQEVHGAVRSSCERYYGMCCSSGGASIPGVRLAVENARTITLDGKCVSPEALQDHLRTAVPLWVTRFSGVVDGWRSKDACGVRLLVSSMVVVSRCGRDPDLLRAICARSHYGRKIGITIDSEDQNGRDRALSGSRRYHVADRDARSDRESRFLLTLPEYL